MSNSASPNLLESLSITLSDLVARTAPTLVSVHSHRARSSGFAWRPNLVVTAEEALAEDAEVTVILPGPVSLASPIITVTLFFFSRCPTPPESCLDTPRERLTTASRS